MRALEQKEKEEKYRVEKKLIYRGGLISLETETYAFEEKRKTAEIIHHPGASVILPIDSQGNLLFVEQWRRGAREILIELPAGTLNQGEDPKSCALRELQEETGYFAKKIELLGGFFTAPGFCDEYLHLYLATDLVFSPLPQDDDEGIDLLPLSLSRAKELVKNNVIRDAKTIAAIFWYADA